MDDFDEYEVVASDLPLPEPWVWADTAAVAFTLGADLFGSVAQAFVNLRNCALAHAMYMQSRIAFQAEAGREIERLTGQEVSDG